MLKIGKICATALAAMVVCDAFAAVSPRAVINAMPDILSAPLSTSSKKRETYFIESMVKSVQSALRAGMPSLAQSIAEDALKLDNLDKTSRVSVTLALVDSFIAQGDFESAQKALSSVSADAGFEKVKIRSALANVGLGQTEAAHADILAVDESKISDEDVFWYRLARGYAAYDEGKVAEALAEFGRAKTVAGGGGAFADAEIAENFCRLAMPDDISSLDDFEKSLDQKVKIYFGTPRGFQFAKQRAAALYILGRVDDALEVAAQQLDIELAPQSDKDELRLMSAAMTKDALLQKSALKEILERVKSPQIADYALSLLSQNKAFAKGEFAIFIAEMLKNCGEQIRDRVLIEAAKNAIREHKRAEASKFAEMLAEKYPNSKYNGEALRIIAWAAFAAESDKAPEYRLTANTLLKLSELEKNKGKAVEMLLSAADCFLLDKDYVTASKIYSQVFPKVGNGRGTILNKIIDASLAKDDIDSATKTADSAYAYGDITDDEIWNAEWKIISRFRNDGDSKKAFARINHAISSTHSKALQIRMQWLLARLAEQESDFEGAIARCDKIVSETVSLLGADETAKNVIAANAMLMKARCLEALGKTDVADGAFSIYRKLRRKYPATDAAKVSYLYEARAEAARGNFADAQNLCLTLAHSDPQGTHAYNAVFDAAYYARKTGLEADCKSALKLLDRLCADFPSNPRNFYARLAQAEILRLVNAFADARKLYDEILNKYPSHGESYLAQLGLGDCSLAQEGRELDAAAIFERLYSSPNVPDEAKAEAAFKYCYALDRAGRNRDANEMRFMTSDQLLQNKKPSPRARYWIGRTLHDLASALEKNGNIRDARAACELIVNHNLPARASAEQRLKSYGKK